MYIKRKITPVLLIAIFLGLTSGCNMAAEETVLNTRIVVQNYYWAKPGMEEDVYQQRLLASHVRSKYGHPVGRVLRLTTKSDSLPDVIWECDYPNVKAREKDVERITHNEEFSKVADKMGTLLNKFDRAIYEVTVPVARVE